MQTKQRQLDLVWFSDQFSSPSVLALSAFAVILGTGSAVLAAVYLFICLFVCPFVCLLQ